MWSSESGGPFAAPAGVLSLCSKGSAGTKWANVTEVPHSGDEEKVDTKLNLDVFASHFSHHGVKGNSVAGRPCQGGGPGKMFSASNVQSSLVLEGQEEEQQCSPRVCSVAGDARALYPPLSAHPTTTPSSWGYCCSFHRRETWRSEVVTSGPPS